MKPRTGLILLTASCLLVTLLAFYWLGGVDIEAVQDWLGSIGLWAPVGYVLLYVLATLLILPSTALNLMGGALFGPWLGTLWTTVAALVAAVAAFAFTRTVGREALAQRLSGHWQAMDREVQRGGFFYMFAIRLLPIIPYGLVNFAAGLTSISRRDYLLGTLAGTVPGVLPFVMLGSSGLKVMHTGEVLPLLGSLALLGILVAGAGWYQRRHP